MRLFFRLLLGLTLLMPVISHAIEEQHVRDKAHTVYGLYLTPFEAYNMKMQQGDQVLLVDVRTRPELKYVGASTVIDANIPSRFIRTDFAWSDRSQTYRTTNNDHFVADMEKLLQVKNADKTTPIILMCTSGSRVPSLARKLQAAGFTSVYSLYQGFEGIKHKEGVTKGWRTVDGWKNAGLPWSYKLNKQAMYFNFDSTQSKASD